MSACHTPQKSLVKRARERAAVAVARDDRTWVLLQLQHNGDRGSSSILRPSINRHPVCRPLLTDHRSTNRAVQWTVDRRDHGKLLICSWVSCCCSLSLEVTTICMFYASTYIHSFEVNATMPGTTGFCEPLLSQKYKPICVYSKSFFGFTTNTYSFL
jgi:hypothetical protein